MALTRKDITTDTAVRDKYINGVLLLKQEVNQQSGLSTYDALVAWHVRAMMKMTPPSQNSRNAAHRGPVFLPWHRYLLIVYEQQLQRILQDTTFALPYWAWNRDGDLPAAQQSQAPIWGGDTMGGSGDPVTTGPFANPDADPDKFIVRVVANSAGQLVNTNRGLRRDIAGGSTATLPTTPDARAAISPDTYDEPDWGVDSDATMRNLVEGWQPPPTAMHNRVHNWIGGDMAPASSPNDPVFFLNHCNVDRLWAAWRQNYPNAAYLPGGNAPASLKYHRLTDKLFSVFPNAPKVSDMIDVSEIYSYDTVADVL